MTIPLVTFSLAGRTYGLPVSAVQEVLRIVARVPLPDAPPEVLGAINVRGTPTLVFDLRQRLGLPHQEPGLASPLLLVRIGDASLAVLVDRVNGVAQTDTAPDAAGLVRIGDELAILLSPADLPTAPVLSLLAGREAEATQG
jgi:purine-binding chemotaxis protein CheW